MKPDKPPSPPANKPDVVKPYDSLLDPLPQPDVTESNTDTAWGLWESSLGLHKAQPESATGFDNTVPAGLDILPPKA